MARTKNFSTVQVDSELKAKIEFLTKMTKSKSQNELMNKIINPLFEVGCYFRHGELESYPLVNRQNCVFQFYRTESNIINFGKNNPLNSVVGE
jgi:cob(I)alamin adenosyltransferase